jgi:C-terminal processing protease CtpA/Prc
VCWLEPNNKEKMLMTRKKLLYFLTAFFIMILFCHPLFSQAERGNRRKIFTADQLRKDFAIFRNALEEGHAGLYRYTPKTELDEYFESIAKKLDRPTTELDFYRMLAPLIAHIHDGHTSISLSQSLENILDATPNLFPFNLRFIDEKAYLFRNYSEREDITMGSELHAINGHPVYEIVKNMMPFIPNDAHIQTSKYRKLERTAYFGNLFNLIYGQSDAYVLICQTPSSDNKQTFTVRAIKSEDITVIARRRYPEIYRDRPPIELEFRDDVAILTLRTFSARSYKSAKIDYPRFLETVFQELEDKKIAHLIVDLRDNGGGTDAFGKILFAHFFDKPFRFYEHLRANNIKYSFFEYTGISPQQQKEFLLSFKKNEEGSYDLKFHPNLGEQKPIPPIFKGKAYVLLNGNSFSGTGECTSLMHFHKVAVFIGEECGSGYYGNTSGFMPRLTLPNTKIRVRIPMIRYTMAVSGYPKDRGIIPDYPVSPTIKDLLNDKDTVMAFTLDLINKSK